MTVLWVIALSMLVFLALLVNLAAKPGIMLRISGFIIALSALGAVALYGWAYAVIYPENMVLAVIRASSAAFCMFLGRNDFAAMELSGLSEDPLLLGIFWFIHFAAIYSFLSAAMATLGAGILRRLRIFLARRSNITVVYSLNENSVEAGKQLLEKKGTALVFVDESADEALAAAAESAGAIVRTDPSALMADRQFFRSLAIKGGKRRIRLCAMDEDAALNLRYAGRFMASLERASVPPECTGLSILCPEEKAGESFQALGGRYGYGSVSVFNSANLGARLLMRLYPPCWAVEFDSEGRARQDFEALVIGFGDGGQCLLRHLVMNAQFEGSRFHAAVFDPGLDELSGSFITSFPGLMKNYDIEFHSADGRSPRLYEYLKQHGEKLRYAVICTGSEKLNAAIEAELSRYFAARKLSPQLFSLSRGGIRPYGADSDSVLIPLYSAQVLSGEELDRGAMALNHSYSADDSLSMEESWKHCDYFSRMSSRASADFVPSMLCMAGMSPEEAREGWALSPGLLENLSRTEHLRWCAFHYAMGYETMGREEFEDRLSRYKKGEDIRIAKDREKLLHACLIPWEELDGLSRRENAVTGGSVDYKQMDVNNVLMAGQLAALL